MYLAKLAFIAEPLLKQQESIDWWLEQSIMTAELQSLNISLWFAS